MIVKLRNKDGQFCTLEQFCADEPMVEVSPTRGISYAAKEFPAMRENLVRLEQLLEIIGAFDLPIESENRYSDTVSIEISRLGSVTVCAPGYNTDRPVLIKTVKNWIAEAEKLAAKWQAIEYEVNDK